MSNHIEVSLLSKQVPGCKQLGGNPEAGSKVVSGRGDWI